MVTWNLPCSHRCTRLFKLMHTFQRGWIPVKVGTKPKRGCLCCTNFSWVVLNEKKLHLFFIILRNLNVTEKHKGKQNNHIPTTQMQHLLLCCLFSFCIFVKNKILVIVIFKPHPYFILFFSCNLSQRQPLLLVFLELLIFTFYIFTNISIIMIYMVVFCMFKNVTEMLTYYSALAFVFFSSALFLRLILLCV